MTSLSSPPLMLDASTLSNFAWVGRLDILELYSGGQAIMLPEIDQELRRRPVLVSRVFPCVGRWLVRDSLNLLSPEGQEYAPLSKHVGKGEAAVMAYARYNKEPLPVTICGM